MIWLLNRMHFCSILVQALKCNSPVRTMYESTAFVYRPSAFIYSPLTRCTAFKKNSLEQIKSKNFSRILFRLFAHTALDRTYNTAALSAPERRCHYRYFIHNIAMYSVLLLYRRFFSSGFF